MTTSTISVAAAAFASAADRLTPLAGRDRKRPHLNGVLVEHREESLRLVATDSYRLGICDLALSTEPAAAFRAVVDPGALAGTAASLAGETGELVIGTTAAGRLWLGGVAGGSVELDVIGDEFPAYERILDAAAAAPHRATLPSAALREALTPSASAGTDPAVTAVELTLADGAFHVRAGDGHVTRIAADVVGSGIVWADARYLVSALDVVAAPDLVVEVTAATQPLVLRAATDATAVCLVMPVRVDPKRWPPAGGAG